MYWGMGVGMGYGLLGVGLNALASGVGAYFGAGSLGAGVYPYLPRLPCHQCASECFKKHPAAYGYPTQQNFQPQCTHCQKLTPTEQQTKRKQLPVEQFQQSEESKFRAKNQSEIRSRTEQNEKIELEKEVAALRSRVKALKALEARLQTDQGD